MDSKMFHGSCRILTLEQKVKPLEMYDKNPSFHTVGEAFGVSIYIYKLDLFANVYKVCVCMNKNK